MELRPALGAGLAAVVLTLAACEEAGPCVGPVSEDCEAVAGLYRGTWSSGDDGGEFAVSVDATTCGVRGDLVFGSERAPFEGAVCNDGEARVALLEGGSEGDAATGTGSLVLAGGNAGGSASVEGRFDLVIGEDVRASAGSVAPGDLQVSVEGDRFEARGATAACSLGCDDGNPCTDDRCDAEARCVHTASGGSCDDGDPCTTNDTCSGETCLPGVAV